MSDQQPITSAFTPDIEQVRAWLEKTVKAMRFVELVTMIITLITRMRDINTELMKQVTNLRRKRPRSETLERVQKQCAFAFMDQSAAIAKNEPKDGEDSQPKKEKPSRKGRHPGRAELPSHLERIPLLNPVPPELRICPLCGSEMSTVSHSICEYLELIPARLVVMQRMDERVACPHDDAIVSAPTPPQIVERGKLGATLIVESLADKYLEHLPIERQCLRWARTGVDIAPQVLGHSVAAAIDLIKPLARLIAEVTRGPGMLALDASGIPVLDRDAPDGIRNGTMWCWINGRWVTFSYSPAGDAASVRLFLGDDLARDVQCDGTSVTNFIERAGGKRPGCMAHGRRRLVDAARAGDRLALEGLEIIAGLFAVERASLLAGDTHDQRRARRQEHSKPIIDRLRLWVAQYRAVIPPKTTLGRALGYLHRQWNRLRQFLEDGRVELTNNRVERELRKLVLGKKNWLFTWEDLGGERTAAILTIVGTCIAHEINPRPYLHRIVKLILEGWPQAKLRDLLPDRIAVAHPDLLVRSKDIDSLAPPAAVLALPPPGG